MRNRPTFEDRREIYAHAWHDMVIDPDRVDAMKHAAQKIIAGRDKYEEISAKTGVPWPVIGLLHYRESTCNFQTHLHNGDSLKAKTHDVPAGRPPGNPPFTFIYSACDALHIEGFDKFQWDSIERISFALETFNGFGYAAHGLPSAYLYAGTNQYKGGKFVRDGVFDRHAIDRQMGTLGVLKTIEEMIPDCLPEAEHPEEALHASPKAKVEPTETEEHQDAHEQLKQESWAYSIKRMLLKLLGLPASGGVVGLASMDDPAGALSAITGFATTYGWHLLAGALVGIVVLEAWQYLHRSSVIGATP